MRVGAHAALALGRKREDVRHRVALLVEELLGLVAAQPVLDLTDVLRRVGLDGHLVSAPVVLDLGAVDVVRAGPALRRTQYDHGPGRAAEVAGLAGVGLEGEDLLDALVHDIGHLAVHLGGVAALDEVGLPAAAAEEALQLLMADAGEDGRVGYLVAVEVQNGQNRAVGLGVDELVELPAGGERTGLSLAVAHDAGGDESGVVGYGAEGMRKAVTQLAALVDGARGLGSDVARDAAGEGELLEEALHALAVTGYVGVDFLIAAVQPVLGHHCVAAVTGAGNVYHVEVKFFNDPVQVGVDEVLTGDGAPVADDLLLDVVLAERLLEQGVVQQIELAGGEIVGGTPVPVHGGKLFLGCGLPENLRHLNASFDFVRPVYCSSFGSLVVYHKYVKNKANFL